jgi:hypothetical protein
LPSGAITKGGAFGQGAVELHRGLYIRGDLGARIGGDGKFVAAFHLGKFGHAFNIARRHPNDGGAHLAETVGGFGEKMRFNVQPGVKAAGKK